MKRLFLLGITIPLLCPAQVYEPSSPSNDAVFSQLKQIIVSAQAEIRPALGENANQCFTDADYKKFRMTRGHQQSLRTYLSPTSLALPCVPCEDSISRAGSRFSQGCVVCGKGPWPRTGDDLAPTRRRTQARRRRKISQSRLLPRWSATCARSWP